jgi:hypothetical protein
MTGLPEKRIDLTAAVAKKAERVPFFIPTDVPPASLIWIEEDTLLVTVRERDDWLYSFIIKPSTSEIRPLKSDEQEALRNTIEEKELSRKNGLFNDFSGVGKVVAGLVMGVAVVTVLVVSGGRAAPNIGGSGRSHGSRGRAAPDYDYEAMIENNGYRLRLDASYEKTERFFFDDEYEWLYRVKNEQRGSSFSGKYLLLSRRGKRNMPEFKAWVRSWRISPDGRYYLIGKTATVIDAEAGKVHTVLIKEPRFISADVSPAWNKLAFLMMEKTGKTGLFKCWLEIYPFTYPGKTEPPQLREPDPVLPANP